MSTDEMRRERNRVMDARRRKRNTLAQLRGEGTGLIDAAPIRAHVNSLTNLGWSYEAIIKATGCAGTHEGLRLLTISDSGGCERKWVAVLRLPVTLNVPATVPDQCLVPSLGGVRRVRALMAQGWRHEDISAAIGRDGGSLARHAYSKMTAGAWHKLDAGFDRLSAGKGGSAKTATRARKAGYAPALAWDDIDDPNGTPVGVYVPPTTITAILTEQQAKRAADLEHAVEHGHTLERVCADLGLTRKGVARWCQRHEQRELWTALAKRDVDRDERLVTGGRDAA